MLATFKDVIPDVVPGDVLSVPVHQPEPERVPQGFGLQFPGQLVLVVQGDADGGGGNHRQLHQADLKLNHLDNI